MLTSLSAAGIFRFGKGLFIEFGSPRIWILNGRSGEGGWRGWAGLLMHGGILSSKVIMMVDELKGRELVREPSCE